MNQILDKPGFISIEMGSERLRNMFQMRGYLLSFFFPASNTFPARTCQQMGLMSGGIYPSLAHTRPRILTDLSHLRICQIQPQPALSVCARVHVREL